MILFSLNYYRCLGAHSYRNDYHFFVGWDIITLPELYLRRTYRGPCAACERTALDLSTHSSQSPSYYHLVQNFVR